MLGTLFASHARVIFTLALAAAIHAAAFYGFSDDAPVSAAAGKSSAPNLNIRFSVPSATIDKQLTEAVRQPEVNPIESQNTPAKQIRQIKQVKQTKQIKQKSPVKPKPQKPLAEPNNLKVTRQSAPPVIQAAVKANQPLIVVEDKHALQQQEDRFINEILNQIENNKFYPTKARRRNIQGTVKVELKLDDNGSIVSLQLFEGHRLLRQATATAIQASAPFDTPPSSLTDPQSIKFGVHYQFR